MKGTGDGQCSAGGIGIPPTLPRSARETFGLSTASEVLQLGLGNAPCETAGRGAKILYGG